MVSQILANVDSSNGGTLSVRAIGTTSSVSESSIWVEQYLWEIELQNITFKMRVILLRPQFNNCSVVAHSFHRYIARMYCN